MAFTGNYVCNVFKTGMPSGTFNLNTGTSQVYKIALYTNAASLDATTATYTGTAGEVVASGYTAGGETLVVAQTPTTGAAGTTAYLSFNNVSWTGAITARGALIYLEDGITNPTVCVLDFGADKSSSTTFTVQFPSPTNTSAIIRIS